ncbi:MAG: bifunctional 2-C-methyl-D-erythritol 4-phosphate cytidylyltransferase/2-C-methyl-D-erythritol 2,4-cyclodiphosphate synthase [Planktomarina sp.]
MNNTSKIVAIIVAGGRGTRAGANGPKQWEPLAGRRVADWTVGAFAKHPAVDEVIFVHHADDTAQAQNLQHDPILTIGGATRVESVQAGLNAAKPLNPAIVLIHDAARPCVDTNLITRCIAAAQTTGAAAPALAVTDALWRADGDTVADTVSRDGLMRAQTPQCFDYNLICAAQPHCPEDAADDVAIARAAGHQVTIVEGSEDNLKITYPADFARAERILKGTMKLRVGNGYDVHKFTDGDHVILCGVKLPHDKSLLGHSDADVAMHAVTDAIYGALAEGDIGRHFPPSEPEWRGADSAIFLEHAVQLAAQKGFSISNIDCTIVCEHPKIGPHADAMQRRMADLMDLDTDQVSIKATTSEKLGFTGRGEGIAAIATAALVGL